MAKSSPEKLAAALRANLKRRKAGPGDPADLAPVPDAENTPKAGENPAPPATPKPER